MTGQNEVLPENLEADVWSRDQMYSLKYSRDIFLINHPIAPIFLL
jgi:hypothetical protein